MAQNPDHDCFRLSRFALFVFLCATAQGQLRLNQIQVIGSHNSYHSGLAPSEAVWLGKLNPKSALRSTIVIRRSMCNFHVACGKWRSTSYADVEGGRYARPDAPERAGSVLALAAVIGLLTGGLR